jgi:transposase-like protein
MPQMLLPIFPSDATEINALLGFCRRDDFVYYFNGQMPIFSHHISDIKSFRLICSQLVVNGVATQSEIIKAFGISKISMKRYVKLYRKEGAVGFFRPRKTRSQTILTPGVVLKVQQRLDSGETIGVICKDLDLKPDTVNKAIRAGRLHRGAEEKKSPLY